MILNTYAVLLALAAVLRLLGLPVVVGLPPAGHWARSGAAPGCEQDGLPVEPLYRVRVGCVAAVLALYGPGGRLVPGWLTRREGG